METENAGGETVQPEVKTENEKDGFVKYESHKKLLDEKKKVQDELEKFKQKQKEDQERILKEKEDYKAIVELREKELNEVKQKHEELNSSLLATRKFQLLNSALGNKLDSKYFALVDTDKIIVDPETGRPDPTSVKTYAEEFRKEHPIFFTARQGMPNEDSSSVETKLSYDEWLKLPVKEQKKRMKEL